MKAYILALRPVLVMLGLSSLVFGLIYPGLVTFVVQSCFPGKAGGSLIHDQKGQVIGSKLIGQNFDQPKYFWGRLSSTSPDPYNAQGSGGSNLGVNNPALIEAVKARLLALHVLDPENKAPIPVDLVTASASGLDPDISPAAAYYQVARIARARHADPQNIRDLITKLILEPSFGLFGERRVNVLQINQTLDKSFP